jgi:hypothetical protein
VYEPGAAKRRQGHALRGGEDRRSRTRPAAELALHSAEARAGHSSSRRWGNDILTSLDPPCASRSLQTDPLSRPQPLSRPASLPSPALASHPLFLRFQPYLRIMNMTLQRLRRESGSVKAPPAVPPCNIVRRGDTSKHPSLVWPIAGTLEQRACNIPGGDRRPQPCEQTARCVSPAELRRPLLPSHRSILSRFP